MMKKAFIFTSQGCLFCAMVKSGLKNESIPFTEIDIAENKDLWDNVKKQIGGAEFYTPTIFIQEESNGEGYVYVPKKDFQSSNDAIAIIKNNILI